MTSETNRWVIYIKSNWILMVFIVSFICRPLMAANQAGCDAVTVALRNNSTFIYNKNQNILSWLRPPVGNLASQTCNCSSSVGGLGPVIYIKYYDNKSKTYLINRLCSSTDCPGGEIPDPTVQFSLDDPTNNKSLSIVGPCDNITAVRCACSVPTTATTPIMTTTTKNVTCPPQLNGETYNCDDRNPCIDEDYQLGRANFPGEEDYLYVECTHTLFPCLVRYCFFGKVYHPHVCQCVDEEEN